MSTIPYLIEDTNISTAWCKILEQIVNHSGNEISPMILTLTQFEETDSVRKILDDHLSKNGLDPISTVSETIFPQSLYNRYGNNRTELYNKYLRNLPRIKATDRRNRKGTYFERLIAFGKDNDLTKVNQLEIIITSLEQETKIKRRSKLQAAIFDPLNDHTNEMFQGFPCLQHVTFYKSETGGLILNSFYAIQWLYQRAYGNWLGLVNLGRFIAKEANMKFERFNCFVGVESLDHLTKLQAKKLLEEINR